MDSLFYRTSIYFMVIFRHRNNKSLQQVIATDGDMIECYLKLNHRNHFLEQSLKELNDES